MLSIRQSVAGLCVIVSFCFGLFPGSGMAAAHVIHYASNPSYDSFSITSRVWAEIDLIYHSSIKGRQYVNTVQLLRPIRWLKQHLQTSRRLVIGRFERYVNTISSFTFRDSLGHLSNIMATPNHPFYVENKHAFLAIEDVSTRDQLVGMSHGRVGLVQLVCASGQHSNCGTVPSGFDQHRPTKVYNLEVYRRHVYLVGRDKLLVHNGCPINKLQYEVHAIGTRIDHPIEFEPNDVFVRIRHKPEADGPLKYHASLHVFGHYRYTDDTITMRTIEMRAAEDSVYHAIRKRFDAPIVMRNNTELFPDLSNFHIRNALETKADAFSWVHRSQVHRLDGVSVSKLDHAVSKAILSLLEAPPIYGVHNNCNTFICAVLQGFDK